MYTSVQQHVCTLKRLRDLTNRKRRQDHDYDLIIGHLTEMGVVDQLVQYHHKGSRIGGEPTTIIFKSLQGFLAALSMFRTKQAFKYVLLQSKITSIVLQIQAEKNIEMQAQLEKSYKDLSDVKEVAENQSRELNRTKTICDKNGAELKIERNGVYHCVVTALNLQPQWGRGPANEDARKWCKVRRFLKNEGLIHKLPVSKTNPKPRWVFVSDEAMVEFMQILPVLKSQYGNKQN